MTMRKIIGPALIALLLAGCAVDGDLPGESGWSRDYFKVTDKKQSPG
jgi:Prokaryotic membrane lipoprotein lipid attachment site